MALVPLARRKEILRGCSPFAGLPEPELEGLAARLTARRFAPGQAIFGRGEPGSSLLAVADGRVRIAITAASGREMVLGIVESGELFGELTALDGKTRSADATALGSCVLLALDRRDLMPVLRRSPEAALSLAEMVCGRVRASNERLEGTLFMSMAARLARLLLRLATSAGEGPLRVEADLCQTELGRLIGASRQKVNARLRGWTRQGLLARDGATLVIRDPVRLRALAEA